MKKGYLKDKTLLEKRLKELSLSPYTGEICKGAMCYMPIWHDTGEYECVVCALKTTYQYRDYWISDLVEIRDIVAEIRAEAYDIQLDESEYCQYCSKNSDTTDPKPVIKIRFCAADNYHTVRADWHDIKCLQAFLKGVDHFTGAYDETIVLHENIDIICKVTGLGGETVKAWLARVENGDDPINESIRQRITNALSDEIDENFDDDENEDD
jgi:predicted Rdx family selenoprotein